MSGLTVDELRRASSRKSPRGAVNDDPHRPGAAAGTVNGRSIQYGSPSIVNATRTLALGRLDGPSRAGPALACGIDLERNRLVGAVRAVNRQRGARREGRRQIVACGIAEKDLVRAARGSRTTS